MLACKRLGAIGFLLLLGLWTVGVGRSFTLTLPEPQTVAFTSFSSFDEYGSGRGVANNLKQIGIAGDWGDTPLPQVFNPDNLNKIRIFEKNAHLSLRSTTFSSDEELVRQAISAQQAMIFSETASGIAPDRSLALGIRVHPDRYDALLHDLSQVGQLGSITAQLRDRTDEFRRLHAQRQSLRTHQDAILKLRGSGKLSVEEALKLEQKLLEIDKENQSIGVHLGELLDREPSYNLFLTLKEYQPGSRLDRSFTLARRLGSGLLWALGWWWMAALGIGLLIAVYASIRILRPSPRRT
jgi:hypothetical protein